MVIIHKQVTTSKKRKKKTTRYGYTLVSLIKHFNYDLCMGFRVGPFLKGKICASIWNVYNHSILSPSRIYIVHLNFTVMTRGRLMPSPLSFLKYVFDPNSTFVWPTLPHEGHGYREGGWKGTLGASKRTWGERVLTR